MICSFCTAPLNTQIVLRTTPTGPPALPCKTCKTLHWQESGERVIARGYLSVHHDPQAGDLRVEKPDGTVVERLTAH